METELYKVQPVNFIRRLWAGCAAPFIMGTLFGLLTLVTSHNKTFISGLTLLLVFFFFIVLPFFRAYTWAKQQIISVSGNGDTITISLLKKNKPIALVVKRQDLKTKLSWSKLGRPYILKLSIYENDIEKIKVYSSGKELLVRELESIAYAIKYDDPIL
jgi:hypothetical protein